jgi:hypothetical protein
MNRKPLNMGIAELEPHHHPLKYFLKCFNLILRISIGSFPETDLFQIVVTEGRNPSFLSQEISKRNSLDLFKGGE